MTNLEATRREYHGVHLCCPICRHDRFVAQEYAMRSTEAEILKLAWASEPATAYICENCKYILWFRSKLASLRDNAKSSAQPAPLAK
jgi:predicted nucleic-acid-binding Zn-ribbon protein